MDPDKARQNVRSDLDPNLLILMVFLKEFFIKVDFEKKSADHKKKHIKNSQGQSSRLVHSFCVGPLPDKKNPFCSIPSSSENFGKLGKSQKKVPCMENHGI